MTGPSAAWAEQIELPAALNVLALAVIARAVDEHADQLGYLYPDVGDADWARIVERAREMSRPPTPAHVERYTRLLARRAEAPT